MNIQEVYQNIRKLAKTNRWQTIYSSAKELHLQLFKNTYDLSDIQITFLNFLAFYNNIYLDIYMNEIDDIILKDFIYEDAYSYYKHKKNGFKKRDNLQTNIKETTWIFNKK